MDRDKFYRKVIAESVAAMMGAATEPGELELLYLPNRRDIRRIVEAGVFAGLEAWNHLQELGEWDDEDSESDRLLELRSEM